MDKQSLLNSLNNASFRVNKRYHDAKPYSRKATDFKDLLAEMREMQDAGDHDTALEVISEAWLKKPEDIDMHSYLLISESVSYIATNQADKALASLEEAETLIPEGFSGRDNRNYIISRNLSSIHVNMSTCFILKNDYTSAVTRALIARNEDPQWHGPHIALFSSLLRIIKDGQCDNNFTIPNLASENSVGEANHEFLVESINAMANDWPNWNSDVALLSHIVGDENTVADTDLVGVKEIIENQGYSLNQDK